MFARICAVGLLFVAVAGFAQDRRQYPDYLNTETPQTTEFDRLEIRSYTRQGWQVFGAGIPDTIEFRNPRIDAGTKFGRNNEILGVDYNTPSSRFRNVAPEDVPRTSQSFEAAGARPQSVDLDSVNKPMQGAVAGPQSLPIRRPVGFFERPGVMEQPLVSEESVIRTPVEQRWFRERGVRRGMDGPMGTPLPEQSGEVGGAIGVGGEDALRASGGTPRESALRNSGPPLQPLDPVQTQRKYEEKLEGMLLADPRVHLLSPVQISFQNGVATVRGVVTDQTNKVAVGQILLADPAVKQVNNMISVVPLNPAALPPPIDVR